MKIIRIPIVLAIIPLLSSCTDQHRGNIGKNLKVGIEVGSLAPDIDLHFKETSRKLSDYRGKIILLNFWATWCPPCVEEYPSLQELKYKMWGKDFEIIAVNVDEDGFIAIDRFTKNKVINVFIASDPKAQTSKLFNVFKFPESFLLDRNGTIVEKIVGPRDWSSQSLIDRIDGML